MSLNRVELIGFVGGEPRLKEFDNGGAVCNVSIATTDKGFTTKDGKKIEDKTEWHNVVFRNQMAKYIAKHLQKGNKIYVDGKITSRQYQQDGQTKTITEIIVKGFELFTTNGAQETETDVSDVIDKILPF